MTSLVAGPAERVFTGAEWTEGPVWIPATRRVRFSDIPNDRVLEHDPATGATEVARHPVDFLNGRTLDAAGRVVACSHGGRRVEIEPADAAGEPVVLVDRWEGGRFNSPNDVVVARDGAVWFTDPDYGIQADGREGYPGEREYGACFVFRHDPATGGTAAVVTDMDRPNGLAFSPDESVLYVADTGAPQDVRAYDVAVDGAGVAVTGGRRVATMPVGAVDGLRIDAAGRLWCSAGDGVRVLEADGTPIEHVAIPETVSNVCFGEGAHGEPVLWATASASLYRIPLAQRVA